MNTKIIKIESLKDVLLIQEAAKALQEGQLVAFPTETVYGIGANALKIEVVKRIYEAKGRPSDNPLIVHIGGPEEVARYATDIPEVAYPLMARFWPGPLTMIFKKKPLIPDEITGGLKTVGLRVPGHPLARAIIKTSGLPIAAPSANLSGKPSPTEAAHVIEDLMGRVDLIVDGGSADIGLESTVLDMTTTPPMILRPGGVTRAMLEEVIGQVAMDAHLLSHEAAGVPRAPGMKYRHYAPKGQLSVYEGDHEKVIEAIRSAAKEAKAMGKKVGIIVTDETKACFEADSILSIGSHLKPDEVAKNLFRILRAMDQLEMDVILTESYSRDAIGEATMNRLLKAAGNRLYHVGD